MRAESSNPAADRKSIRLLAGIASLLLIGVCVSPAEADTIILKDGSFVQSERVWETEKFVHFILSGTKTVEIRYNKTIVERIVRKEDSVQRDRSNSTPPAEPGGGLQAYSTDDNRKPQKESGHARKAPDPAFASSVKGISFYHPQRDEMYWAWPESRHNSLQSALEALAGRYDRSVEWVIAYMGEENDLGNIHKRLAARCETETAVPGQGAEIEAAGARQSAGAASNSDADSAVPSLDEFRGLKFYEPRRAQKYWTDDRSHYATLNEAVNALAAQYGMPAQWITRQMGETNDLDQIHRNIRKALPRPEL